MDFLPEVSLQYFPYILLLCNFSTTSTFQIQIKRLLYSCFFQAYQFLENKFTIIVMQLRTHIPHDLWETMRSMRTKYLTSLSVTCTGRKRNERSYSIKRNYISLKSPILRIVLCDSTASNLAIASAVAGGP